MTNNCNVYSKLDDVIKKDLYNLLHSHIDQLYIFIEEKYVERVIKIAGKTSRLNKRIFSFTKEEIQDNIKFFKVINQHKDIKALDKNTIFLVIGSYYTEICMNLESMGFKNFYVYSIQTFNHIWKYHQLLKSKNEVNEIYNSLEDDTSKKVIENILKTRITNNYRFIDQIQDKNLDNEYFDKSIVPLHENETFIDAGAYVGDTLVKFLKNVNFKFNKAYLFEPDKNNYYMLKNQLQNNKLLDVGEGELAEINIGNLKNKINYYNLGVFNEQTTLDFLGSIGVASHIAGNIKMEEKIDEKYNTSINLVKLDHFIDDSNITLIKMDIEGAEIEALEGCKDIIVNQRPKLIICIYHKENHLWKIPLYIKKLNLNYTFFIRHYGANLWDTICYAIPVEKTN